MIPDPGIVVPWHGLVDHGPAAAPRANGAVPGGIIHAVLRLLHCQNNACLCRRHGASFCQYFICSISAAIRAIDEQSQ